MKRPDIFLVGVFKSGTTAVYEYLRAHPEIFMSVPKEPLYFGQDLTPRYRRMTEEEYLELFRGASESQRAGEASPVYLYSTTAAREIADFSPRAQILVILRNPVDVMYSQHAQLVFNLREDLTDFGEALAAEEERRRGERIPDGALRPEALFYRHSVRYVEQLRRYFDVFGRERVHVALFDDLVADPQAMYRSMLEFLGVDATFEVDLSVYNPSRQARSGLVQQLLFTPPRPLRGLFGRLRQMPLAHRVRDRLLSVNSAQERRPPMDPELRAQLTAEFAPQVRELSELIGRDLSPWTGR